MILAESLAVKYQVQFTDGTRVAVADTTPDKGGTGLGFRPHELLEAAVATCMTMSLRMYAEEHGLPLSRASVAVSLDRSNPDKPSFEYRVEFHGPLSHSDKERLLSILEHCPVRRTLSQRLHFRPHRPATHDGAEPESAVEAKVGNP